MRVTLIILGMLLFSFLGYFLKIYDFKSSIIVFISLFFGSIIGQYLVGKIKRNL